MADWYNMTIDSYSGAVTLVEFLLFYLENNYTVDFIVINILEAMLGYNKCDLSGGMVHCENDSDWWE